MAAFYHHLFFFLKSMLELVTHWPKHRGKCILHSNAQLRVLKILTFVTIAFWYWSSLQTFYSWPTRYDSWKRTGNAGPNLCNGAFWQKKQNRILQNIYSQLLTTLNLLTYSSLRDGDTTINNALELFVLGRNPMQPFFVPSRSSLLKPFPSVDIPLHL